jgi:class 3 adenylate cyclase
MIDLKKTISAYDRFVPHRLLQLLGKKDITKIKLGDNVEKKITILFSDIRDFTTLSESLTPQENFNFINTYLCQMDPIISSNNGVVGNFIGDAIMAIFPEGTEDAYKCSLSMLKQLRVYNEGRIRAGYQPIRIGIGLNTGLAMIGTVGGHNRMDGTVISDAVNLCSRIESLTKVYKIQLLIGEDTYNDLSPERKKYTRFVDRVLVKGKLKQQSIYEVFEIDDEHVRKHKRNSKDVFEEALANYHYGEIDVAKRLLEECLSRNVNDEPIKIYLD